MGYTSFLKKRYDKYFETFFSLCMTPMLFICQDGKVGCFNHPASEFFGFSDEKEISDLYFWQDPNYRFKKPLVHSCENKTVFDLTYSFESVKEEGFYKTSKEGIVKARVIISQIVFSQELKGQLVEFHNLFGIYDGQEYMDTEKQMLELVFNSMTEGLALHEIILNERGQAYDYRFLQVNPSFEKIMGLKSADITGKTVRQILPNVEQYWIDTYAKVALEGETLRINNFSSDLKKYFDVITFSPKKYYFAVLALDITEKVVMQRELIKAKEEAEAAWRAKNIFIANMSHELRNPMNGIMGFVDLLCESELNDSQREYVNIIHDSSFSLLRILNDIIDFSRLDSSAMSICEEMTDIRAYMSRIYEFFLPSCSLAGNSFVLETDSMIPRSIFMDKERYRQVISNLIGNAIKFCRNGKVEVKLSLISKTDGACEISFSVKDSGIGIKEEDMHKLFRPFSQIDSTPAKKYSGTGLGLAISQRIIQAFGSEIKVDSLPGKGSIFHFIMKFKYKD